MFQGDNKELYERVINANKCLSELYCEKKNLWQTPLSQEGVRVLTLLEKCPNTEFFRSVFPCISTGYSKIRTRKSSLFGHFSRSVSDIFVKEIAKIFN